METPLRIVIIGAGIGGLAAGLALRQNGHHVTIIESSKFSNETGAAIHIAPNANGLLRRLGVYVEDFGANECRGIRIYTPGGQQIMSRDFSANREIYQHSWQLINRGHLHLALWAKAIAKAGRGSPCILRLGSRVRSLDPQTAEAVLENGEVVGGDVLIGADGVHSICRAALDLDRTPLPFDHGQSAFRFLIPIIDLLEDPVTRDMIGPPGTLSMVIDNDRRLVFYPCVNDTIMNCLLIHPSSESRSNGQDWNQKGDKKRMLEIGSNFGPIFHALLSKAPDDSLKVWTLLDLEVLPRWVDGNMALLGDAAHPFLPHQAQGGAQAIEDAVSLAVVLPLGTKVQEVHERLELYQQCRKERADHIQAFTRISGMSFEEQKKAGVEYEAMKFNQYNFSHDEWDHSSQQMEKFLWSKNPYRWRQPVSFGPSPGPRQPLNQLPDVLSGSAQCQVKHSIRFRTSGTYLRRLFPTSSFSFRLPNTIVEASIICCSLKNMVWLGGTGYNHCGLYIHGVQYAMKSGEILHGTFLPVLFENLTDPIITGREELAAPKLGCDIDIDQDIPGNKTQIQLSWRGTTFARLDFGHLTTEDQREAQRNGIPAPDTASVQATSKSVADDGMLMYRYVPAVGAPGVADAEYAVFEPYQSRDLIEKLPDNVGDGIDKTIDHNEDPTASEQKMISQNPRLTFESGDWSSLPTIHHITKFLADMPIFEIINADIEKVAFVGDVRAARRIE